MKASEEQKLQWKIDDLERQLAVVRKVARELVNCTDPVQMKSLIEGLQIALL